MYNQTKKTVFRGVAHSYLYTWIETIRPKREKKTWHNLSILLIWENGFSSPIYHNNTRIRAITMICEQGCNYMEALRFYFNEFLCALFTIYTSEVETLILNFLLKANSRHWMLRWPRITCCWIEVIVLGLYTVSMSAWFFFLIASFNTRTVR